MADKQPLWEAMTSKYGLSPTYQQVSLTASASPSMAGTPTLPEDCLMTTLDDFAQLSSTEQGLAVVATLRADSSIQSSLVNVGVLDHPLTGEPVVAFVTYGRVKLANLRARPQLTVTVRSGWQWAAIEGTAQLIGPDDPRPDVDPDTLRRWLRDIFTAAGGAHDDWEAYDRVMLEQRRAAVFVAPKRIYSNA
jgi:PPOX class probable F420-dependent enzyme